MLFKSKILSALFLMTYGLALVLGGESKAWAEDGSGPDHSGLAQSATKTALIGSLPTIVATKHCNWKKVTKLHGKYGTSEDSENYRGTLVLNGIRRAFVVHLPPQSRSQDKPMPLVLMCHGAIQNGMSMPRVTGLSKKSDEEGFIVCYPDGTTFLGGPNRFWNATDCCGIAKLRKTDDVAFISALIDSVADRFPVDRHRVYMTGFSNGAMLAYRTACEIPDKIAAIAIVSGSMSGKEKSPVLPVPIIIFHGTDDKCVPFKGGKGFWKNLGFPVNRMSVDYAVKFWRGVNHCDFEPKAEHFKGFDKTTYSGGKDGSDVVLLTIEGGEHAWPGGRKFLPLEFAPTKCVSATDEMWSFFSRHTRN